MMAKTKPLLPSLREKKRYLAYGVISQHQFNDAGAVSKAIGNAVKEYVGMLGAAHAGIIPLNDQWNKDKQRGIIRVNHKHRDTVRAAFTFIQDIESHEVIVRSVGASGILQKAKQNYL
jgi:RNase P/RNase MRP subunit POP5